MFPGSNAEEELILIWKVVFDLITCLLLGVYYIESWYTYRGDMAWYIKK